MASGDPFEASVMARGAVARICVVAGIIAGLWLAIAWAVMLP
jgi:hypothetical protein